MLIAVARFILEVGSGDRYFALHLIWTFNHLGHGAFHDDSDRKMEGMSRPRGRLVDVSVRSDDLNPFQLGLLGA
jgi:hypothetical protein